MRGWIWENSRLSPDGAYWLSKSFLFTSINPRCGTNPEHTLWGTARPFVHKVNPLHVHLLVCLMLLLLWSGFVSPLFLAFFISYFFKFQSIFFVVPFYFIIFIALSTPDTLYKKEQHQQYNTKLSGDHLNPYNICGTRRQNFAINRWILSAIGCHAELCVNPLSWRFQM